MCIKYDRIRTLSAWKFCSSTACASADAGGGVSPLFIFLHFRLMFVPNPKKVGENEEGEEGGTLVLLRM